MAGITVENPCMVPGNEWFEAAWLAQEWWALVEQHMRDQDVSRTELARRMGVSQPRVTVLMRCDRPTLETMARVALALGLRVGFDLHPVSEPPRSACRPVDAVPGPVLESMKMEDAK